MDDTIKTKDDLDRVLKLPLLGSIARFPRTRGPHDQLLDPDDLASPLAEAYRATRTNLQFTLMDHSSQMLLVSSALPKEGKTTTACNLGLMMAKDGKDVIICDADLRRPSVHRVFGIPNRIGLSTLLRDDSLPIDAALTDVGIPGLKVLCAGPPPPNPAELLGSRRMMKRALELEELADVIIFDCPALLPVVDAAVISKLCNAALLVIDARSTRVPAVRRAREILDQAGLAVLGAVLTKVKTRLPRSYYGYYTSPNAPEQITTTRSWLRRARVNKARVVDARQTS
jgi:capsular exopolysaccharide synthesis family protein